MIKCKKCFIGAVVIIFLTLVGIFLILRDTSAQQTRSVVINEIAWMGTTVEKGRYCEWIELYNTTDIEINLSGWGIYEQGGDVLILDLTKKITAHGYYLIERVTNSCPDAVPEINADDSGSFKGNGLSNSGEYLVLKDANANLIDEINSSINDSGWFAGENIVDENNDGKTKQTMERINPNTSGNNFTNWISSIPEGGTPKAENSNTNTENIEPESEQEPAPTPQPEPEPTPTPTPTSEPTVDDEVTQDATEEPIIPNSLIENSLNNTEEPTVEPKFTRTNNIIITEFLPNPAGNDAQGEWIEIYNSSNQSINIKGWMLDDGENSNNIFIFPDGLKISAYSYLVFSRQTTNITLTNTGDTVRLLYPNGNIAYETSYFETAKNNISFALIGKNWEWTDMITPGSANLSASTVVDKETKKIITSTFNKKTKNISAPIGTKEEALVNTLTPEEFSAQIIQNGFDPFENLPFIISGLFGLFGGIIFYAIKRFQPKDNPPPQHREMGRTSEKK